MKIWKILTIVALTLTGVTLVTASAFAYLGGQGVYSPYGAYSSGMMNGHMGYSGAQQNAYPTQPNVPTPTTPTYPYQNGEGCMRSGRNGYVGSAYSSNGAALTIDTAVTVAQRYLTSLNNPDLAIDEVEEYTQNFYVLYYEKSTGFGAFEMLIDKYSGSIYSEMGPNIMWNTKYGMMSGMMGTYRGTPTAVMPITVDQAKASAQQFLNANLSGTTVGDVTAFYGYYHIDVLLSGNIYGMLSVNGYTGQVWYHNWHGNFVQQVEL